MTAERLAIGFAAQREGNFPVAETCYREILLEDPINADAQYLLGFLCHQQGLEQEALHHIQEAVAQRPREPQFAKTLGDVFLALNDRERARECYHRSLRENPAPVDSYIALGALAAADKQLDEAVQWYRRAVDADPTSATSFLGLGCALRDLENFEGADRCLSIAVRLKPQGPEALAALGEVKMKRGLFTEAEVLFRQSLKEKPSSPSVLNNLGSALKELGRPGEAIDLYLEAYRLDPCEPAVSFNLGGAYSAIGSIPEAIQWYDIATDTHPDYAEAHANKALLLLSSGMFERGWQEYEWRFKLRDRRQKIDGRTFPVPRWEGESFEGKTLLVRSEQGAGDMIQFCRFLPALKSRGGRVLFETAPRLSRLFKNVDGADAVVPISQTTETEFDLFIPLLSVPRFFTPHPDAIPSRESYLFAEPELIARTAPLFQPGSFNVGICWQGNREYVGDKDRSMPLKMFAPLFNIAGVRFYSLQKGDGAEQLGSLPPDLIVEELGSTLDNGGDGFVETAAALTHLDLVISTDTALPHLAGALGRPVWVLLSSSPEWRWFTAGDRTPWYPTMRLFRRRRGEEWKSVIERVSASLAAAAEAKTHTH